MAEALKKDDSAALSRRQQRSIEKRRDRQVAYKRRRDWCFWRMYGVQRCPVIAGDGECPYFTNSDECGQLKRWRVGARKVYPPCAVERRVLRALSDDLVKQGIPAPVAMALAGNQLQASRTGETKLLTENLKNLVNIAIEALRLQARMQDKNGDNNPDLSLFLSAAEEAGVQPDSGHNITDSGED